MALRLPRWARAARLGQGLEAYAAWKLVTYQRFCPEFNWVPVRRRPLPDRAGGRSGATGAGRLAGGEVDGNADGLAGTVAVVADAADTAVQCHEGVD